MINKVLICKKTKDNNFIVNKEYIIDNGYIYSEFDISINTSPYNSVSDAIQDLTNKGYIFELKSIYSESSNFNNCGSNESSYSSAFDFSPENIFGDIFSMYNTNSTPNNTNAQRIQAENLKNDILKNILNL